MDPAPPAPVQLLATILLAAALGALIGLPSLWLYARVLQDRRRAIDRAADRTGLRRGVGATPQARMLTGAPRGLPVQATERAGGWVVEVELLHPVAAVAHLRRDPRVATLLTRAEALPCWPRLGARRVRLTGVHPGHLEEAVVVAVELGLALQDAFDLPLATWARVEGLPFERSPGQGLRAVHGAWQGRALTLVMEAAGEGVLTTARLSVEAPEGLAIRAREPGERGGTGVGDPFLDRLLVVQGGANPAARALLADGARMAPLLELVSEHPGSRVEAGAVHLLLRGPPADPGPALHLLAEVADALEAAGPPTAQRAPSGSTT